MPEQFIKVKRSEYGDEPPICDQEGAKQGSGSNISNSNGDICRICHCEADPGNPLLSPCYCAGSLKYVHQTCLQQWLAASDTRSCELCKFNFIVHTKIKPISEWRRLEMSSVERRRLLCAILFHFVAAICVVWSLFVLIDRAAEEVQKGLIAWPFWTKLVVVAVGFTGGAVFMYIQCRQYLHLFSRWKAHNRIILVQNAPEKPVAVIPPPNFTVTVTPNRRDHHQVVASVECNMPPHTTPPSAAVRREKCAAFTIHAPDVEITCDAPQRKVADARSVASDESLELNIQEILGLDVDFNARKKSAQLGHNSKTDNNSNSRVHNKTVFKSLPNLSASSENLLV